MSEIIPRDVQEAMMDHIEWCDGFGCVQCRIYGEMMDDLLAIYIEKQKLKERDVH